MQAVEKPLATWIGSQVALKRQVKLPHCWNALSTLFRDSTRLPFWRFTPLTFSAVLLSSFPFAYWLSAINIVVQSFHSPPPAFLCPSCSICTHCLWPGCAQTSHTYKVHIIHIPTTQACTYVCIMQLYQSQSITRSEQACWAWDKHFICIDKVW